MRLHNGVVGSLTFFCVLAGLAAATAHLSASETSTAAAKIRSRRVLVFHATWCGPCERLVRNELPHLKQKGWQIGEAPSNHIQMLDADRNPSLMNRYGVSSLPALVLIDEGKIVSRRGYLSAYQLAHFYLDGISTN